MKNFHELFQESKAGLIGQAINGFLHFATFRFHLHIPIYFFLKSHLGKMFTLITSVGSNTNTKSNFKHKYKYKSHNLGLTQCSHLSPQLEASRREWEKFGQGRTSTKTSRMIRLNHQSLFFRWWSRSRSPQSWLISRLNLFDNFLKP